MKDKKTCIDCEFYISYDRVIGICRDENNEHYNHVIHKHHPYCGIFLSSYKTIEEELANMLLDNHQDV